MIIRLTRVQWVGFRWDEGVVVNVFHVFVGRFRWLWIGLLGVGHLRFSCRLYTLFSRVLWLGDNSSFLNGFY